MSTPARRGAAAASDADAGTATQTARVRITEIFRSLQGEADATGWPTVFVRLTGCPLRCVWCDTEYAFQGGDWWDVSDLVRHVVSQDTRRVCVTGGEPLAQKGCLLLLRALCDAGLDVSLETSGALDVSAVDPRVGSWDKVRELARLSGAEIRKAKEVLAFEATMILHGEAAAGEAREAARQLFGRGVVTEAVPSTEIEAALLRP